MTVRRRAWLLVFYIALAAVAAAYATVEPSLAPIPEGALAAALKQARTTLDSPTFLEFAGLTAWLIYGVVTVSRTTSPVRLVRHGSYARAVSATLRRSTVFVLWGELVTVVGAMAVALARGPGLADADTTGEEASLEALGLVASVVAQGIVLLVALATMRLLLEAIAVRANRRSGVIVVAVVLWVWGAASATGFIGSPTLDLRSYTSVEILAGHPPLAVAVVILAALVWVGCIASVRHMDASAHGRARLAGKQTADFSAGILTAALGTLAVGGAETRLVDVYASVLRGPGGTILQSLTGVIIFVGYAFVFQFRVNQRRGGWGALNLIRFGSVPRYVLKVLGGEAIRAAVYVVVIAVVVAAAFVIAGGTDASARPIEVGTLLLQLLPVAFLQLMFYVLVIYVGITATASPLFGPIAVAALSVLSFVPFDPAGWLPIQRASILGLSSTASSSANLAVLAIACALALTALLVLSHTRRARSGTQF